jgi:FtsH-binding integral membrane protein
MYISSPDLINEVGPLFSLVDSLEGKVYCLIFMMFAVTTAVVRLCLWKNTNPMELSRKSGTAVFFGSIALILGIHASAETNPMFSIALMMCFSAGMGLLLTGIFASVEPELIKSAVTTTAGAVAICWLVGTKSGLDLTFLGPALFWGLLILVILGIINSIRGMQDSWAKIIGGIVIFSLYLTYDLNRLAKAQAAGETGWNKAIQLALSVYLDILNLFLEILKAYAKSKNHH